jgi:hypothetical protein
MEMLPVLSAALAPYLFESIVASIPHSLIDEHAQ